MLLAGTALAATLPPITLAWNQNPEPDIAGYELNYGTTSGSYNTTVNSGVNTSVSVSGLSEGVTYFFAVIAYNSAGMRSQPSSEVSYQGSIQTPNQAPESTISTPSSNLSITAGDSVSFAGSGSDPDNNTPLAYLWNFGSGSGVSNSTLKNPGSRQFNTAGIYQVTLTVTDAKGLPDPTPAQRTIVVTDPPPSTTVPDGWISEPVADVTIVAGQSVGFASGGTDSNGNGGVHFAWNFGSNSGVADSTLKKPVKRRFDTPGTYVVTLTVTDADGVADPTPAKRTITVLSPVKTVSRNGWRLLYADSVDPAGYEAARAFDGSSGTFWHTQWQGTPAPSPHEIQINLGGVHELNGFRYLPRQDGVTVGNIAKYQFYTSMDGVIWGRHVASGRFPATSAEKRVLFPGRNARYIRLVSLCGPNETPECNIAELNLLEAP